MLHFTDTSMKNFITVGTRAAVAALFACVLAAPALAATCEFRPNAPDQHLVVRGDTLWDISGKFLEHPWCWPQVWGMNQDQIRNPHWIYPGEQLRIPAGSGQAGGVVAAGEPAEGPEGGAASRFGPTSDSRSRLRPRER